MTCVPRFYPGAGPGGGGAAPDVTVATFADLPTTRPDGYLVAVTAQSGLTEVVVRWDDSGGVWLLEQATCAYSVHSATEWTNAGEWYDTGGITVLSADGARIYDTTYDTSWRWDEGTGQFVPPDVYDGTIVDICTITGASATPPGFTVTDTDAGGTASITTDGTKLTLSAITSGAGTTIARVFIADASIVAASKVYLKVLMEVSACTSGTPTSGSFVRVLVVDNAKSFDFGNFSLNGGATEGGLWFNASTTSAYSNQATINQNLTTAETLVEIYKIGANVMARAGGSSSPWLALAGATARAGSGGTVLIEAHAVRAGGTSTATGTYRQLRAMRY